MNCFDFLNIYPFKIFASLCGLLQLGEFIFYAYLFANITILADGELTNIFSFKQNV